MTSTLHLLEIPGTDLDRWLDALGDLRIRVFREFPYLYDGTLEYEREYLRVYGECAESRVVLVTNDRCELVGATTCLPLAAAKEFQSPFADAELPVDEYLYCGESVVLPEWRGRGLGKEFFARREAHARSLGMKNLTFCAVDRPDDHPLRPADYLGMDGFWQSLGFVKQPHLRTELPWKEIGEIEESPKTLTFWTKTCAH